MAMCSIGQLSTSQRQLFHACLGEEGDVNNLFPEGYLESNVSEQFGLESLHVLKRVHFIVCSADEDDNENLSDGDTGSSLEDMYRFEFQGPNPLAADETVDSELEEMYKFDLQVVAEALKQGANLQELSEVIEDSMADALESRLHSWRSPSRGQQRRFSDPIPTFSKQVSKIKSYEAPDDCVECNFKTFVDLGLREEASLKSSCLSTRHLYLPSYRRNHADLAEEVANRFNKHSSNAAGSALATVQDKHFAAAGVISTVLDSIAKMEDSVHQNLLTAAKIIDVASVGSDNEGTSGAQSQLNLVTRAVDSAARRHRLSVAKAVMKLSPEGNDIDSCSSAYDDEAEVHSTSATGVRIQTMIYMACSYESHLHMMGE